MRCVGNEVPSTVYCQETEGERGGKKTEREIQRERERCHGITVTKNEKCSII